MEWLYSIFFGAGLATFAYTKMSQRLGYGNTQSITIVVGVTFFLSTLFFYTILHFVLNTAG